MIVDRLTKSAHFILINISFPVSQLAEIYIREIVRLHGVPSRIVSDRDPRFTSRQTDGQSKRTIQSLEDLLRVCVLEQGGTWNLSLFYLDLI